MAEVALVIPVHDDDAALTRLLECIATLALTEVIVVDGAASPSCRALCESTGVRYLAAAPGRGTQLNAGAGASSAPVLWFLHADAAPRGEHLRALGQAIAGGAVGGCFRFAFHHSAGFTPRLLERGVALRIALGGVPYGDQGLFARRSAFEACGGFDPAPLFEEVSLVRALRRHGHFVVLAPALPVSPRRWQRDGWWRRTFANRSLALRHALGASPTRLAHRYHGRHDDH